MDKHVENKLKALIDKSGNSDVDLVVNIETKAIAYSILCGIYARGDIDEKQLERAIEKLDSLIERDRKRQKETERNIVEIRPSNRDNQNQIARRRWI